MQLALNRVSQRRKRITNSVERRREYADAMARAFMLPAGPEREAAVAAVEQAAAPAHSPLIGFGRTSWDRKVSA